MGYLKTWPRHVNFGIGQESLETPQHIAVLVVLICLAMVWKGIKRRLYITAMGGDSKARNILGLNERKLGNMDRALEHYMIAVKGGDSNSLESIKAMYMDGDTTKEDYTKALQSYQIYLDEIKSDQRDEAAADGNKYYESAF